MMHCIGLQPPSMFACNLIAFPVTPTTQTGIFCRLSEKFMNKSYIFLLQALCNVAFAGFPTSTWAAPTGIATLTEDGRSYSGTYSPSDKLISVEIDGLTYRGYFASYAEDNGRTADAVPSKSWGRAFLFASSAKVLQCQLEAGFPMGSGQCQSAEGRKFELRLGAVHSTISTHQRLMAN